MMLGVIQKKRFSAKRAIIGTCIGKQRALSLEIWPIPNIDSVIGYSYVPRVVPREYSVLSTGFNNCPLYFKVQSKITRDFAAQCSMFTYTVAFILQRCYN